MSELAKIITEKKLICPHCNRFIEELDLDSADTVNNLIICFECGKEVAIPEDLSKLIASKKNTGKIIDIIG
jgi:DNA-directed RNA polymerase subunit RPC12/RpoP